MTLSIPSFLPPWLANTPFVSAAVVVLAVLAFFITRAYLSALLVRLLKRYGLPMGDKNDLKIVTTPLAVSAFFTLIYGAHPLPLAFGTWSSVVARFSQIGLTVAVTWALIGLVDVLSLYLEKKARSTKNKFDDVLVPLLRTSGKILVISIGVVLIGQSLAVDITGLIAGLGIGGIALALAAKDTLSNFFASITVILDRPFEIGDWVALESGVEGTVLRVGFRSTRIKTFYDSEISIPNSQLGNLHCDNYGRRKYRRFSTKIGVQYDTPPEKIEAFCEGIRNLILQCPHSRKDYFHVYLNEMGDSDLKILVYIFWEVKDWSQELTERHRFLIDVLRLAKSMGIEFAFPTQTLHLFNEEKTSRQMETIPNNFHETGQKLAQDITKRRISPLTSRSSLDEAKKPPLD
ncbi:MAG: mechanosensitive ion channel [Bacteriovoracales bacterium]|nr:mechanosensitive ion channel [Bacteriovoracales bacterium]